MTHFLIFSYVGYDKKTGKRPERLMEPHKLWNFNYLCSRSNALRVVFGLIYVSLYARFHNFAADNNTKPIYIIHCLFSATGLGKLVAFFERNALRNTFESVTL